MKTNRKSVRRLLARAGVIVLAGSLGWAGNLEPPGPPAPTMKSLDQLEPRIAVQSLPGDRGSVHVIDQPGSYYLAGDVLGGPGLVGISITADNVVLDLNGFTLLGNDGDSGINLWGNNNVVRNGTLRGWPVASIWGANCAGCTVEDVVSEDSGSRTREDAISLAQNARVSRVTVRNNPQGTGIRVLGGSLIESCVVSGAWDGYVLYDGGSHITGCTARGNNGAGIFSEGANLVERCVSEFNGFDGVQANTSTTIRGNVLVANAAGVYVFGSDNRIEDNLCVNNGEGIVLEVDATANVVQHNQLVGGGNGVRASGTGNLVFANMALDCATDYDIGPGNTVGQIVDFTAGGIIDACGPWTDFRY